MQATNETIDLGNNESKSRGVFGPDADGMFTALTFSKSKRFKTRGGAERWYKRQIGDTSPVLTDRERGIMAVITCGKEQAMTSSAFGGEERPVVLEMARKGLVRIVSKDSIWVYATA